MDCVQLTLDALNQGQAPPDTCAVYEWGGSYYVGGEEIACSLMGCHILPRYAALEVGNAQIMEWIVVLFSIVVLWLAGLTLVSLYGANRKKTETETTETTEEKEKIHDK